MNTKLRKTSDGSYTLYSPSLDEHYHSVHGAVTESMHVFIGAGLNHCKKEEVRLLEIGLGTGLNAILTFIHAKDKKIYYHAIEKYPPDNELIRQLDYSNFLSLDTNQSDVYFRLHDLSWNVEHKISPGFTFIKYKEDIKDIRLKDSFDVIYFDAFAPQVQPEMWENELFDKLYKHTNIGGVMVTYCAKGEVRRKMQKSGFAVERLQGPPGKREMLRAIKNREQ